jgi:hypothetical protein
MNGSLDLWEAMRSEFAWFAAQRHHAEGRHREALRLVRSLSLDPMRPLHWRVFEILQLSFLKRHQSTLREVYAVLERARGGELTPDERYLICFAQWCGRYAFTQLSPQMSLPPLLQSEFRDLELEQVSPRLRRLFPLPIHPGWVTRWSAWGWPEAPLSRDASRPVMASSDTPLGERDPSASHERA